jgi:hypothetical protein
VCNLLFRLQLCNPFLCHFFDGGSGTIRTSEFVSFSICHHFVRMDYIHFSVMALLLSLGLFAALRVIGMLAGTTDGLPETRPESDT